VQSETVQLRIEVRRPLRRRHDAAPEADTTEQTGTAPTAIDDRLFDQRVLELSIANWRVQGFAAITMCAGQLNATVPSRCT
jgi:hypothetical protein